MSEKLEVSLNSPQCGWMSVGFSDSRGEFHTTTAHAPHSRALPELMNILAELLDPLSPAAEYVLQWNRDPEEFDFRFARATAEAVDFEVYQYPTSERRAAERQRVFAHRGAAVEVAAAFAETFAQLYEDRETDEFEFNWRQPFPIAEFEKFKAKMNAAANRRPGAGVLANPATIDLES